MLYSEKAQVHRFFRRIINKIYNDKGDFDLFESDMQMAEIEFEKFLDDDLQYRNINYFK